MPVIRRSPIPVLTGPDVDQLCRSERGHVTRSHHWSITHTSSYSLICVTASGERSPPLPHPIASHFISTEVISATCDSVCALAFPRSTRKAAQAINIKLGTHNAPWQHLGLLDPDIKRSKVKGHEVSDAARIWSKEGMQNCINYNLRKKSTTEPQQQLSHAEYMS